MRPDDLDAGWLWRMRREAGDAASLAEGLTREQLGASMRDQRAIAHAIEQLGEAAGRVSAGFRAAHPEIQWRRIIGARNRLAHDYERTDWEIIWTILQASIPGLLEALDTIIPPADSGG
jgi:uncharacterized protein with HEPN domain